MTDAFNLGEQLRKIRADKRAAEQAAEQARVQAVYERSQSERSQIRVFWMEYVAYAHDHIQKGKEPAPRRVPDVFVQQGVSLDSVLHSHHDVWREICTQAEKLGLEPKLNYCHDGMGMTSWYEFHVEPL